MRERLTEHDLTFLRQLAQDPDRLLAGDEISEEYSHDELSGTAGWPQAVFRAKNAAEVSAVMRYANEHAIPVTPRGAGTGLVGAAVAVAGGILLDLSLMNQVLELDEDNLTLTVEPGVLLMDLDAMRREVRPADIFDYAREHADILLLPDQDVLNGLYGGQILGVDDSLWNYDARRFDRYLLVSQGEKDMDWVMAHTAILHFCGKRKPWNHSYQGRFSALYKHYQRLVERR